MSVEETVSGEEEEKGVAIGSFHSVLDTRHLIFYSTLLIPHLTKLLGQGGDILHGPDRYLL